MSPARANLVPLELIFDPEDEALIKDGTWGLSNGYPTRRRNGKLEYLHVLIAGALPDMEVDHINGNRLDVRRSNFRHVLHVHNAQNLAQKRSNNTSGYRGVSFHQGKGRWRATAVIGGRQHFLGYFDSADGAAEAARSYRLLHMEGAMS